MKLKYGYLLKKIPIWVPLTLLSVVFLLVTLLPRLSSLNFIPDGQLAYITSLSGDVNISDGISDVAAKNGAVIRRNMRTILKTGIGNASLKMRDNSYVILDASTTIEFNRQYQEDPENSFAFNLESGRALVINTQDSHIPTQLFVGGEITAQVYQGVVGLEARMNDQVNERVDCLIGPCTLNGVIQLLSGQSVSIGLDRSIQVAKEIPYDSWISLEKLGTFSPALSELFARIKPALAATKTDVISPLQTAELILIPLTEMVTSTSNRTITFELTATPSRTPTPTQTFTSIYRRPESSLTFQPTNSIHSTMTPVGPNAPTLTRNPIPSVTSYPTWFYTPQVTNFPSPTFTLVPSSTPIPTVAATKGRPTLIPSSTLAPTIRPTSTDAPTRVPTDTPVPTAVPTQTDVPPTQEPIPTDTPGPP